MRKQDSKNGVSSTAAQARQCRGTGWRLACAAAMLLGAATLAAGCGKATTAPRVGSETHFLDACGVAGCAAGLECIDGLCSRSCESDSECALLAAGAVCSAGVNSEAGSCQLLCAEDGECRAVDANFTCSAGRCGAWSLPAEPVGAVDPVAAADPIVAAPASPCSTPPAASSADVFEVNASVSRVPGARSVLGAVADATGLYWLESDGSLLALPRGSNSSVVLRPPTTQASTVPSLVSDRDHLYWNDLDDSPPPAGAPPLDEPRGLLFRIAKTGGDAELLLRLNQALYPLAAADSVVLLVAGSEGLHALEPQGLRRISSVPVWTGGLHIRGDVAYWTQDSTDTFASELFSAPLSGGPARRLGELPYAAQFLVGDGVVVTERQQLLLSEPQRWVEHFLRIDTATGCALELPGLEQAIEAALVDDRHVYWRSVNYYAGTEPLDAPPEPPLLRMDLESLRIERLMSPELPPSLSHDLIAQDDEHLYLRVNGTGPLLAVRKPD